MSPQDIIDESFHIIEDLADFDKIPKTSRQMIQKKTVKFWEIVMGVVVKVSVPEGEELVKKTFN
ncbi:MAG: hypothetical protein MRK01_14045 [Candidatus Scalindua sp.]|nr:hypothetical protein [Candidatus Scalindua sp.]